MRPSSPPPRRGGSRYDACALGLAPPPADVGPDRPAQSQVALFTLGSGARALPRAAGLAAVSRVLRALRRQGLAVLVCAGLAPFLADDDSSDGERLVVGRVPHGWLLPQVALAVHHGGAGAYGVYTAASVGTDPGRPPPPGTFHAACRAGCRQVVCPLEFDQVRRPLQRFSIAVWDLSFTDPPPPQPFWADLARARGVATVLDLTET